MKKIVASVAAGALAVSLLVPAVAFAGPHQGRFACKAQMPASDAVAASLAPVVAGCHQGRALFVDADGNGVRDRWENGVAGQGQGQGFGQNGAFAGQGCAGFVDEDGDGFCDNHGTGNGAGLGYVDEDGDGVCDNYAGQGTGQGGQGAGYVDADGDGVCDNYGSGNGAAGQGQGAGQGNGNGHHGSGAMRGAQR